MDFFNNLEAVSSEIEPLKKLEKETDDKKDIPNKNQREFVMLPSNLHPINFVDFIEKNYSELFSSNRNNSFKISQYKSTSNLKLSILNFHKYSQLNTEIFKSKIPYTSMTVHLNFLYLGDENGTIHQYNIAKNVKEQEYSIENFKTKLKVSSLDITQDGKFIISGYSNGTFALWDIDRKNKPIYDNSVIHSKEIIAIKFFPSQTNEPFEILTSDFSCQVHKIKITKNLFGYYSIKDDNTICKEEFPIFLIEVKSPKENKEIVLVALATIEKIVVFRFYNDNMIRIYEKSEPLYERMKIIPDVSFGYGCEPKVDKTGFLKRDDDDDENSRKLVLIMGVSWNKVLKLYKVTIEKKNAFIKEYPSGHFVNQYQIIRIGFISPSIIYFFDTQKQIKVINTLLMKDGDYLENNKKLYSIRFQALIDEGRVIDPDIRAEDISLNNKRIFSYRNFVLGINNRIVMLCAKKFHIGQLLNYMQYIQTLVEGKNWMDALSFGLDIFQGNISSFPGIPLDPNERKSKLNVYLKKLIVEYINANIKKVRGDISTSFNKKINSEKMKNCMDISIEFCLGFKAIDFLFTEVQQMFDGYSDDFVERVEPFIFSNMLKNEAITPPTLSSIIITYGTKSNYSLLSHLLTHLNFESINNILIDSSSDKYNLLTTMIYVDSNSNNPEVNFKPIRKMYSLFIDPKTPQSNESYVELNKRKGITHMEKIKNYIGHKLLWYIDLSLNGKKLHFAISDNDSFNVKSKNYSIFIAMIYVWIISEKVFETFLVFDSYSLFFVLEKLFTVNYLVNIIKNFDFCKGLPEKFKKNYNIENKNYQNIKEIIELICKMTLKKSTFLINQDLNMFKIKIAANKNEALFSSDSVIKSAKEIFSFYSQINGMPQSELKDPFKCHGIEEIKRHLNSKINSLDNNVVVYINEISKSLNNLFSSEFHFSHSELLSLISVCTEPFILVQIKIYELMKDYNQCIDVHLNHLDQLDLKSLLSWIERKMEELNNLKNKNDFHSFQDSIIENIQKIFKLAPEAIMKLVDNFFSIDKKFEIAKKLETSPEMELIYVNKLIKEIEVIKEKEKEKENSVIAAPKSSLSQEEALNITMEELDEKFKELLMVQFNLLADMKKQKEILDNFHKRLLYYPIKKCIEKCIEMKIIDSCVFLYQAIGESKKAFDVAMYETRRVFNEVIKMNNDKVNERENDFKKVLDRNIKICEDNSEQLEDIQRRNNNNNLWVDLLKEVYLFFNQATKQKKKSLICLLSKEIEEILKKMCLYVNITIILDIVTTEYQDAEYKEFRELLTKMIGSNTRLTNILRSARTLLCNYVLYSVIDFKKENIKGQCYNFRFCDGCKKKFSFESNEYLFAFQCGHLLHDKCVVKGTDGFNYMCIVCKMNEIDGENLPKEDKSLLVERDNFHKQRLNEKYESYDMIIKKKKILKLKEFDHCYYEMTKIY